MENGWDEAVGADTDIGGADDEVVGFDVGDVRLFVGGDAFVLIMPFGEQGSDGATDQLREIPHVEPGVFADEFDLATERQIIANQHCGTGNDVGGERFVVWSYADEEKRTHEVHIRFEGYAARVAAERQWHSTQAIRKLKPDGSAIEFQADLSGLEEITRWVLSWGSKAKVLGPPGLVKRVREELEKMIQTSEVHALRSDERSPERTGPLAAYG